MIRPPDRHLVLLLELLSDQAENYAADLMTMECHQLYWQADQLKKMNCSQATRTCCCYRYR